MKKILLVLLAIGTMVSYSHAEMKCAPGKCGAAMKMPGKPKKMMKMFQSVSKEKAILLQEGKAKAFCPECGMSLPMFYKTNHAAHVNGKTKQYCSIHCVVEDMQKGSTLTDIKVVDTNSLKFIDATKAFYVVGSSKKGTMTAVSKYAFSSKADADAFAKVNGGKVVDFKGALEAAKADFAKDSKMIAKKQAMMAKKGEMMYGKMCQKTDKKFATTAEAKAFIIENKLCKGLNGKQLQAVGLYLKNR
ncbi:nitrous oxide reductase accessory protein NosL [Sulfurovum sp. ST-21]|uniref:Nitrous oxide reductase accessory protein NosL n=1 Tax=Sulfurovum indicum TaxID=2779528 RepID=A0A7M1S423_9BACT|nr:nitrous oxide reductase accessory protein NosL [Sulfurovum indicum]QOR62177.1 nitrous oxide reductase accessory protein NosL [Sulfurovum indicum]